MLGKKDILILAELRRNARESLTNISKRTSIPVSTIYDKLRQHDNSVIRKYVTLINFSELGFNTRASILLRVSKEKREPLSEFLIKHIHVNSASKINNGYDFHVECMFKTIKELEEFTEYMEEKFGVKDKKIFFLIDDIKRETFFEDPHVLGLV